MTARKHPPTPTRKKVDKTWPDRCAAGYVITADPCHECGAAMNEMCRKVWEELGPVLDGGEK